MIKEYLEILVELFVSLLVVGITTASVFLFCWSVVDGVLKMLT